MATPRTNRLARGLLYTTGAAVAGGGLLYVVYRPRSVPGLEAAQVPPPSVSGGVFHPPNFPAVKDRVQQIADLKKSAVINAHGRFDKLVHPSHSEQISPEDEPYDLLIIGGGATGTGVALDAATRGLKVAMVDRDDFSSGTSSKSTKLVHGGVRYLEKAFKELDYNQYKLVKEALRERRYFLDTAPHLSSWLPIMVPVTKWWQAPYFWAGTKMYDFLAGRENIESSYFMTKSKALEAFPQLRKDRLVGALVYYG
jgi:glycerol-3-phosphate dehydrogenase